jgi:hypothetical protein
VEPFPWPVSLGIAGICLVALISLLVYVTKKIGNGEWIPRSTHAEQLAAERRRGDDYYKLWQTADARGDVLEDVATDIVAVGETMSKVLAALPIPKGGEPA